MSELLQELKEPAEAHEFRLKLKVCIESCWGFMAYQLAYIALECGNASGAQRCLRTTGAAEGQDVPEAMQRQTFV